MISLGRCVLCIVKIAVMLETYALFLKPHDDIMLWFCDPILLIIFYLYFLQRVMMVNLPPLSDGENDGNLLRFLLARDRHQVKVAKIEVDLLQFGAFLLSVKQCFENKPAFCLLKEQHQGKDLQSTLQFHKCQSRLFQDELRGFWHLPHRVQVVAYVPHMSLILYVLPAFMVSEVAYVLAAFQQQQSMNCRLLKDVGVALLRLSCLFVAIPLLVLHYAQVLPYHKHKYYHEEVSEFEHVLDEQWLHWHKTLVMPLGLLCAFSPVVAMLYSCWYYRKWQHRNAIFTLREPLLNTEERQT